MAGPSRYTSRTSSRPKEAPRNTGGSDNSTYNVDYAPSLKQAEEAAADARTRAAATNREENRFKSSEKSDKRSDIQQKELDSREKNNVFLNTIMGGGVGGDPSVDKEDFEVEGQNKLRNQFNYLIAKYGDKFVSVLGY